MRKVNAKGAAKSDQAVCLALGLSFLLPLQSEAAPTRVLKAGDTMTGQLTITGSSHTIVDTNVGGGGDMFSLAVTTAADRSVYHLVVSTNGYVGIGTASPAAKLDVTGNIKAVGSIQIGADATACTAAYAGAIRYNAGAMEFCNGSAWGSMGGGGTIPGGTVVYSTLAVCPAGWSTFTLADGRYMLAIDPSGGVKSTGTVVGTVLSEAENRPSGNHQHRLANNGGSASHYTPSGTDRVYTEGALTPGVGSVTRFSIVQSIASASAINGTDANGSALPAGTNAPYIQLLACRKD